MTDEPRQLTAKQQVFVKEYLIDLNATQAAIRAGYSEDSARQIASTMLTKDYMIEAVDKAKEERSKLTLIDAEWVLRRLVSEAEAKVDDLYEDDGQIKSVHDWPLVWRQGLVQDIEVAEILEGKAKVTKIKISDRVKRLEMIGKHVNVQAYRDQQKTDTNVNISIGSKDADTL